MAMHDCLCAGNDCSDPACTDERYILYTPLTSLLILVILKGLQFSPVQSFSNTSSVYICHVCNLFSMIVTVWHACGQILYMCASVLYILAMPD